jgi:hypothetical protein
VPHSSARYGGNLLAGQTSLNATCERQTQIVAAKSVATVLQSVVIGEYRIQCMKTQSSAMDCKFV